MEPIMYSDFQPKSVNFSALDKNKKGGKIVFVSLPGKDGGNKPIIMQTPALAIPFGVTPYQEATTGEIQSYSIDVSFRGMEQDKGVATFLNKMREFDEHILDIAVARSQEWFGKVMSKEIVSEFYRRLIKDPQNPKYPPVMKTKVPLLGGEPNAKFFAKDRSPTTIDEFVKGSIIKIIVEARSLWFVNKNFGLTWRVLQVIIVEKPQSLLDYAFRPDVTVADAEEDEDAPVVGGGFQAEFDP
jgi:hypothetical protein